MIDIVEWTETAAHPSLQRGPETKQLKETKWSYMANLSNPKMFIKFDCFSFVVPDNVNQDCHGCFTSEEYHSAKTAGTA